MKELGEGRLRVQAGALLSSLISRQETSLLPEERDNRKTEMFMHQFQEQHTAGFIQTSPNFKAKSTVRGTQVTGPPHESCASSH